MVRDETQGRAGTEQRSRALVGTGTAPGTGRRFVGGRPMAGFLTQLIVETDPGLRASRLDRTREAAALYAQAEGRR